MSEQQQPSGSGDRDAPNVPRTGRDRQATVLLALLVIDAAMTMIVAGPALGGSSPLVIPAVALVALLLGVGVQRSSRGGTSATAFFGFLLLIPIAIFGTCSVALIGSSFL